MVVIFLTYFGVLSLFVGGNPRDFGRVPPVQADALAQDSRREGVQFELAAAVVEALWAIQARCGARLCLEKNAILLRYLHESAHPLPLLYLSLFASYVDHFIDVAYQS